MPQHSTILRIISKICGVGGGDGQHPQPCGGALGRCAARALTMITATTMAAMPMRYSFPEKRSSIFWWQSSWMAGGGESQRTVRGAGPQALRPPQSHSTVLLRKEHGEARPL